MGDLFKGDVETRECPHCHKDVPLTRDESRLRNRFSAGILCNGSGLSVEEV